MSVLNSNKLIPELLSVSKKAGKAIFEYDMIKAGDKIAVAVSGGKDSLSLMHVLRHRHKVSPVPFEYEAVHVDFELSGFDPKVLIDYLQKEGFPHRVERVETLKGQKYDEIDCFHWSRARRKALFMLAEKEGFTKICFGHHMDDIAETIILNQFYRGEIGAMKPKQELFGGKITIIRPLAFVREEHMIQLAKKLGIESMGQSKCASDDVSHRMIIKRMLREMENAYPSVSVVKNIYKSLQNIKQEYLL